MPGLNKKSRGGQKGAGDQGMFSSVPRCGQCKVVISPQPDGGNTCPGCKTMKNQGGSGPQVEKHFGSKRR